jgi:hypothetical protein
MSLITSEPEGHRQMLATAVEVQRIGRSRSGSVPWSERAQIRELPPTGAVALAGALAVLELVPERGEPLFRRRTTPRQGCAGRVVQRRPAAE